MYLATLGTFASRDPLGENGVDVLYGDHEFGAGLNDQRNLYAYCRNNPTNNVDPDGRSPIGARTVLLVLAVMNPGPTKPDSFYVCWREIRAQAVEERTARACNCTHVDIFSANEGEIPQGFFGGIPSGRGEKFPPAGYTCVKLRLYVEPTLADRIYLGAQTQGNALGHGIGKGTSCDKASDADIVDCIRTYPKPTGKSRLLSNCQTDVEETIGACCLVGYKSVSTKLSDAVNRSGRGD